MRILTFALLLTLASCVTPGRPWALLGGVEAQQIGPRTWRLAIRGHDFPSASVRDDLVLLQAAQTTIAHGGTHFVVLRLPEAKASALLAPGTAPALRPIEDIRIMAVRPGRRPPADAIDAYRLQRSLRARFARS
jgi:hypothetical protein